MTLRDRKKPYDIMIYYVKEKRETVHFSHLQYYNYVCFGFFLIQIVFKLFSQLLSIYCLFYLCLPLPGRISAMHWMQFTPAFHFNDCDFNPEALVAVDDRKPTDHAV